MSFFTKLIERLSPTKSVFKVGDAVHQNGQKQTMMVTDFHRIPYSKFPLVECAWYDTKDSILRSNVFPEETLVREEQQEFN